MSRLQALLERYPVLKRLAQLPKPALLGSAAALVAVVVVSLLWMREPPYKVLFSNIEDKDGGAIVSALAKMNIPYQMSDSGTAILIPADKVHETRMMLAEQGLPQGGSVGFELMKDTQFGASQFAEQVTYQRAIEGELARSIEAMQLIQSARVHLAIPKETLFVRDQREPTASVLLNLYPGRSLTDGQVAAISWLVASSVPNMTVQNVSIVDQTGRLLSSNDTSAGMGASASKVKFIKEVEDRTAARVLAILSPIVGPQNVHAQVSARVDFNQREQTSEIYRPNQAPEKAAVRSEQINETAQKGVVPAQGVPGALSNEPPPPPVAPITTIGEGDPEQTAPDLRPSSEHRASTVNYEVDRTISHVKESVGQVERLSVAIVVNYRKNEDGVYEPLPEDQLELIRNLSKEAMGFDEARGDTLSVANSLFSDPHPALPIWQDPVYQNMVMSAMKYLILAIVGLLIWFKVVMPFVRQAAGTTAGATGKSKDGTEDKNDLAMDEELDAEALGQEAKRASERYEEAITGVRDIAKEDPRAAALVLREWMQMQRKKESD